MEPVTILMAGAIAKIAFEEFAKAGGGELAKKSIGGAIDILHRVITFHEYLMKPGLIMLLFVKMEMSFSE